MGPSISPRALLPELQIHTILCVSKKRDTLIIDCESPTESNEMVTKLFIELASQKAFSFGHFLILKCFCLAQLEVKLVVTFSFTLRIELSK